MLDKLLLLGLVSVTALTASAEKLVVCHGTGNPNNPFVTIEVATEAQYNAHLNHGDTDGACPDGVPEEPPPPTDPPASDPPPPNDPPPSDPPPPNDPPPSDPPPSDPPPPGVPTPSSLPQQTSVPSPNPATNGGSAAGQSVEWTNGCNVGQLRWTMLASCWGLNDAREYMVGAGWVQSNGHQKLIVSLSETSPLGNMESSSVVELNEQCGGRDENGQDYRLFMKADGQFGVLLWLNQTRKCELRAESWR